MVREFFSLFFFETQYNDPGKKTQTYPKMQLLGASAWYSEAENSNVH